jgi:hypothetical protein
MLAVLLQLGVDSYRQPIKDCIVTIIELVLACGRVQEAEVLVWAFSNVESEYILQALLESLLQVFLSSSGSETATYLSEK